MPALRPHPHLITPSPPHQALVELLLDNSPAPGETLAHVPFFEPRVARVGQRLTHDLAELAQPHLPACAVARDCGTVRHRSPKPNCRCGEMADAQDLKSWGLKKPCGFESHHRHHGNSLKFQV